MEKKVLLFGKKDCSLCEGWKRKLTALSLPFAYYDIGTTEGLMEMAYHNVGRIPALVIGEQRWEEVGPAEINSETLKKTLDGQ